MVVGRNGDLGQSSVLDARLGDDRLKDSRLGDDRLTDERLGDAIPGDLVRKSLVSDV
jgi:hypothetical protein